jgi:hypothetical protein
MAKSQVKNDSDVGAAGGDEPSKHQNQPPLLRHRRNQGNIRYHDTKRKPGAGSAPTKEVWPTDVGTREGRTQCSLAHGDTERKSTEHRAATEESSD